MTIYNVGAGLFVLIALITFFSVVWYTALPPLGAALGLYFWGKSKAHDASEDSDARR